MEEVCPCCNPGYDGAINKPRFLASGDRYQAPKNLTNFFSRGGGGTLRCGTTKRRDTRAGAVHSSENTAKTATYRGDVHGGEKRVTKEYHAFRPSGKKAGLFSNPGILGPSEEPAVRADPRAGGAFKAGQYRAPAPVAQPPAHSPIAPKKSPRRKAGKPFKAPSAPGDFFSSSMYMAEAGGEAGRKLVTGKKSGGKWYPGGKGNKAFNRHPDHLPDPYNGSHVRFQKEGMFYGKDGCMERAVKGPQMYVCLCWSRATPPVEWSKDKVHDMYEHRVAARGNFVYSVMPVNQVPQSMSQRVGKPIAVK